jgi:hypothetical protein
VESLVTLATAPNHHRYLLGCGLARNEGLKSFGLMRTDEESEAAIHNPKDALV